MLVRRHDASDPASMWALLKSAPRVAHHENARSGALRRVRCGRIYPFGTDREVLENMNNSSSVSALRASLSVKSLSSLSSKKSLVRGAAMVEYALLLVAVLLIAGSAYKALGHKVSKSVKSTQSVLL